MTISRETYEAERKDALALIRTTRRVERLWRARPDLPQHPLIVETNGGLRDEMRRSLVTLRYAYYVGMPQEGKDADR